MPRRQINGIIYDTDEAKLLKQIAEPTLFNCDNYKNIYRTDDFVYIITNQLGAGTEIIEQVLTLRQTKDYLINMISREEYEEMFPVHVYLPKDLDVLKKK